MIDELLDRLARLEQRLATLNPVGRVVERDHQKGVRVQLGGTDDAPMLSPWIQPGDWSGVSRYLPDVGQQVMLHSHGGDWSQASLQPLTHSDAMPNPASSADETVLFNKGKIRIALDTAAGTITFQNDKSKTVWESAKISHTIGKNTTTFEESTVTFPDGSKVHHGQRNIGQDHVHSGVMSGAAKTQAPDQ